MFNLQKFKAISLDADDKASAEPKTIKIPKEARESMMKWIEQKIYEVGQGVNETDISGGSITNVVIKAMYEGLNIKSNQMIIKLKTALSDFMFFAVAYINDRDGTTYDYKMIDFEFNLNMLFNEKENAETMKTTTESVLLLKGTMSDETIMKLLIKHLKLDIDADEELARIAAQQAMEVNSLDTPFGGNEDEL
jgi:hypothetical protein